MFERAAYRAPADAQRLGQFAFRRQALTVPESFLFDIGEYWVHVCARSLSMKPFQP